MLALNGKLRENTPVSGAWRKLRTWRRRVAGRCASQFLRWRVPVCSRRSPSWARKDEIGAGDAKTPFTEFKLGGGVSDAKTPFTERPATNASEEPRPKCEQDGTVDYRRGPDDQRQRHL